MFDDCKPVAMAEVTFPRLAVSWWPAALSQGQHSDMPYSMYRCDKERGYLAIDPAENKAYYWR